MATDAHGFYIAGASALRSPQCIPDYEVRHGRSCPQLAHPRCVLPAMMLAVRERLQQEYAGRASNGPFGPRGKAIVFSRSADSRNA